MISVALINYEQGVCANYRKFKMPLSKEAIEEYKKIYKEVEGKKISDEEAREQGVRFIKLFRVLLKINNEEKYIR